MCLVPCLALGSIFTTLSQTHTHTGPRCLILLMIQFLSTTTNLTITLFSVGPSQGQPLNCITPTRTRYTFERNNQKLNIAFYSLLARFPFEPTSVHQQLTEREHAHYLWMFYNISWSPSWTWCQSVLNCFYPGPSRAAPQLLGPLRPAQFNSFPTQTNSVV